MDSFPPAGILAQDVGAITISSETLLEGKPWFLSRLILRTSMLCGTQSFSTLRQWFLHMDVDLLTALLVFCLRSTFERRGLRVQHRLMLHQEIRIRPSQIAPGMHLPMHLPNAPVPDNDLGAQQPIPPPPMPRAERTIHIHHTETIPSDISIGLGADTHRYHNAIRPCGTHLEYSKNANYKTKWFTPCKDCYPEFYLR